jgi:hypothetical protein
MVLAMWKGSMMYVTSRSEFAACQQKDSALEIKRNPKRRRRRRIENRSQLLAFNLYKIVTYRLKFFSKKLSI